MEKKCLTHKPQPTRLAELTTGILCVSFPELGVLLRGRMRRPSMEASTGIREGRYRQQDAAFPKSRPRPFLWAASIAATAASTRKDGGGRRHQHVELDELNLIDHPANAVIIEGSPGVQPHPGMSPRDIGVTREVMVDLNTMV